MILQFGKHRWGLSVVPNLKNDGDCDAPDVPNKKIRIASDTRGRVRLETYIHEFLHASCWVLTDEAVEQAGHDIARALWRLGYRGEK
jgi:hypothetical protein